MRSNRRRTQHSYLDFGQKPRLPLLFARPTNHRLRGVLGSLVLVQFPVFPFLFFLFFFFFGSNNSIIPFTIPIRCPALRPCQWDCLASDVAILGRIKEKKKKKVTNVRFCVISGTGTQRLTVCVFFFFSFLRASLSRTQKINHLRTGTSRQSRLANHHIVSILSAQLTGSGLLHANLIYAILLYRLPSGAIYYLHL